MSRPWTHGESEQLFSESSQDRSETLDRPDDVVSVLEQWRFAEDILLWKRRTDSATKYPNLNFTARIILSRCIKIKSGILFFLNPPISLHSPFNVRYLAHALLTSTKNRFPGQLPSQAPPPTEPTYAPARLLEYANLLSMSHSNEMYSMLRV